MARMLATLGLCFLALIVGTGTPAHARQGALAASVMSYAAQYRPPSDHAPAADRHGVTAAIRAAAQRTGVSYDYLLAQAQIELRLDPKARASTSSAGGLYQFVDRTWLVSVRKHARRFGLDGVAGNPATSDGALLGLREDPQVAALMAAAYAEENAALLRARLGRAPTHAELYLAHFLGPTGAARFVNRWLDNPDALAAALFPDVAEANRTVFFARSGEARSLGAVRALFERKLVLALAEAGEPGPGPAPTIGAQELSPQFEAFAPATSLLFDSAGGSRTAALSGAGGADEYADALAPRPAHRPGWTSGLAHGAVTVPADRLPGETHRATAAATTAGGAAPGAMPMTGWRRALDAPEQAKMPVGPVRNPASLARNPSAVDAADADGAIPVPHSADSRGPPGGFDQA